jgi:hypothetical protein
VGAAVGAGAQAVKMTANNTNKDKIFPLENIGVSPFLLSEFGFGRAFAPLSGRISNGESIGWSPHLPSKQKSGIIIWSKQEPVT